MDKFNSHVDWMKSFGSQLNHLVNLLHVNFGCHLSCLHPGMPPRYKLSLPFETIDVVREGWVHCLFLRTFLYRYGPRRQFSVGGFVYGGSALAKEWPTDSHTVSSHQGPICICQAENRRVGNV